MAVRNHGLNTPVRLLRGRVLRAVFDSGGGGCYPSALARAAFVGYVFRSSQGAAFAVSRVLRGLVSDGLIYWDTGLAGSGRGYRLTAAAISQIAFWGDD